MYLILQQETPEDFVIATGITTSIRDFAIMAFREAGIELEFKGEKENTVLLRFGIRSLGDRGRSGGESLSVWQ